MTSGPHQYRDAFVSHSDKPNTLAKVGKDETGYTKDAKERGASNKHLNRETIELSEAEREHQLARAQAKWNTVSLGEERFATSQRKEHPSQRRVLF